MSSVWEPGVWAASPVWAYGVWFGMGGDAPEAPAEASVTPGWGTFTRKRRKKRVEEEDQPAAEPVVAPPPDYDAPLRAFIANQRPAERRVSVSGPEPMPSDAPLRAAQAAQRAAELAQQIEVEKKRRSRRLAYLLLLGA